MSDFTDTPVAAKFFAELIAFEPIFRDELGPHFEVGRATLARARAGEYPGIRVQAHRLPKATLAEPLDLFFTWQARELADFVAASPSAREHSMTLLREHLGPAMRSALESLPVDLEGASQSAAATVWITLSNLAPH